MYLNTLTKPSPNSLCRARHFFLLHRGVPHVFFLPVTGDNPRPSICPQTLAAPLSVLTTLGGCPRAAACMSNGQAGSSTGRIGAYKTPSLEPLSLHSRCGWKAMNSTSPAAENRRIMPLLPPVPYGAPAHDHRPHQYSPVMSVNKQQQDKGGEKRCTPRIT